MTGEDWGSNPPNHHHAKLLADLLSRDYPTDERGIGNLGRAYLEALRMLEMQRVWHGDPASQ